MTDALMRAPVCSSTCCVQTPAQSIAPPWSVSCFSGILFVGGHRYPQFSRGPLCKIQHHLQFPYLGIQFLVFLLHLLLASAVRPKYRSAFFTKSAFQWDIIVGDNSYFFANSANVDCSFRASMATWALNSGVYFLRDVFPIFDNKFKAFYLS